MKKIILLFLITILSLSCLMGCDKMRDGDVNFERVDTDYISLEIICEENGSVIAYDKETKVMYLCVYGYSSMGITPILNSDGTPKLYDGE